MARLPGVVRQNMADFHSNPLGWDTVQLSPRVYSKKNHIKAHTAHLFSRRSRRRYIPACAVLSLEKRSWLWSGVRQNESPRCRCCFPAANLLFLGSLHVFLLQRPSTPPLAGWRRPPIDWPGREECHVKQTPHKYLHPNLWNGCLWMECLCSLVIIKDENVFGYPRIRRHIWVFSKCFDKLLSFFFKKKNFCFYRVF